MFIGVIWESYMFYIWDLRVSLIYWVLWDFVLRLFLWGKEVLVLREFEFGSYIFCGDNV